MTWRRSRESSPLRFLFLEFSRFRSKLFAKPVRVCGVLVCLFRQLMSPEVVSFAMSGGCGGVGMSCKIVEFSDPAVRAW